MTKSEQNERTGSRLGASSFAVHLSQMESRTLFEPVLLPFLQNM